MSTVMLSLGGELGEGAGQRSWSGRPPKARPKMPGGRCPAHLRPPGRCKGWRGVKSVPAGDKCIVSSRTTSLMLSPVPGDQSDPPPWGTRSRLPVVVLGQSSVSGSLRAQEGSSGSGLPFHPGQVWTGQAHGESLLRAHRVDSVGKRVNLPLHATPSGP